MVKITPNCPEIPATTFKAVGLDARAGSLKFGQLVTVGEISIKSDPQIISGISQSVRDDQTTDALICAARDRGELKSEEQIAHAWKVARFYNRTNPTAEDAIKFHKENPFPATPQPRSETDLKEMQTIREALSGGDSFCFVSFFFMSDAPARPHVAMTLVGKSPLQNIHVRIVDWERYSAEIPDLPKGKENARTISSAEFKKVQRLTKHLHLPILGLTGTVMLEPWTLPDRDQITYQIDISTPYQEYHQHLKLRKVNGEWIQAFRVLKIGLHEEEIVLREYVPDAFSKDQFGKVNWLYF
ncbi:MAG: hypothetical protein U0223_03330 [Nitrospira sp.]|nr:hypothetical protein [Nitrospira sp.]